MKLLTLAATIAIITTPHALVAQQPRVGTLIVAHGGGRSWDTQVFEVAEQVNTGGPVEVSFLMGSGAGERRFQDAARRLVERGATEIVVVPMLVSSHSGHFEQIRYLTRHVDTLSAESHHHLLMAGIERPDVDVPVRLAAAIDDAPEAAEVLSERALSVAEEPGRQALFLVGHGPNSAEDHAEWMSNLRSVAQRVAEATAFLDVKIGLVRDDAPAPVRAEAVQSIRETIELQHLATGRTVVVVPVLISRGQVSTVKLPQDLEGLPISYTGEALLPHPAMARWVEARVREGGALPHVTEAAAGHIHR